MTTLKTIAAAAALAALTATPVFAQAAIQEPGLFAFYHPNLDVLNGGAPTPAARLEAQGLTALQAAEGLHEQFTSRATASRALSNSVLDHRQSND